MAASADDRLPHVAVQSFKLVLTVGYAAACWHTFLKQKGSGGLAIMTSRPIARQQLLFEGGKAHLDMMEAMSVPGKEPC